MTFKAGSKINSIVLIIFSLCFTACGQTKSSAQKNQTQTATKDAQVTNPPNNPQNQTGKEIWSGETAGFRIRWTTNDLTAAPVAGTENVFSAQTFASKGFAQYFKSVKERKDLEKDLKAEIDFYNRHFILLSVVGSLISFEDNLDAYSKIIKLPSNENFAYRDVIESRFLTIDLAKPGNLTYLTDEDEPTTKVDTAQPGKAVLLTDLFLEQDILQALLKDAIIKRAMLLAKQSRQIKQPTNLEELMTILEENLGVKNCPFDFAEDYLTRFAFHHIEDGKVAVRLSLSPGNTACKGAKAQLGLLLPIPASLKESLALADSNKQGFLMNRQATKFTSKQETVIGFDEQDAD